MSQAVRMPDGRFENSDRAYAAAVEKQRDQLIRLFVGAGVSAQPLIWGHSGTISNAALARVINHAVRSRSQVDEPNPHDYGLRPVQARKRWWQR